MNPPAHEVSEPGGDDTETFELQVEGLIRDDVATKKAPRRTFPVVLRMCLPPIEAKTAHAEGEPESWRDFIAVALATKIPGNVSTTHIRSVLGLIKRALLDMYGRADMSLLIADGAKPECRVKFSIAITDVAAKLTWAKSTAQKFLGILRKVLKVTTIDENFIRTITLVTQEETHENNTVLGKHGKRAKDDPVRILLESWIQKLKANTKIKSDLSAKNTMNFIISTCLPAFGLSPQTYSDESKNHIEDTISDELVVQICNSGKKCNWLQVFLTHIVGSTYAINAAIKANAAGPTPNFGGLAAPPSDGADHHRISSENLDKLYAAAKGNILHELTFLLMITTGLRIGGVANIRTLNVAKDTGEIWKEIQSGQTVCKGPKWYGFPLVPRTQKLICKWLDKYRPADPSPFLFPGRHGGHISTATIRGYFNETTKLAGLNGVEMHPHALRHSFAHILLGAGNNVDVVAKLMHHSSSATTTKFYLKESAREVVDRANIPWIKKDDTGKRKREEVPKFLSDMNNTKKDDATKHKRAQKRAVSMSSLDMFKPLEAL